MLLNLKLLTNTKQQHHRVYLEERLPFFMQEGCWVDCYYQTQKEDVCTLLQLEVKAELRCICQRCLSEFAVPYANKTLLALCESEAIAAQLMSDYECVAAIEGEVNLNDLILDDLHLYAPQQHENQQACDALTSIYLSSETI